ncbi:MAG: right-handed parallel beta-helix repeat-containing protein [Flavobacteriaceae bacterium]|nr:right-handed parallel beta-helix repeat-containing protein [Flavobacteriaceae bacterium]
MRKFNILIKHVLIITLIHCASFVYSTTYYIANDGLDSHTSLQAQSPNTPWKTLNKVNNLILSPGDSVLFKRGDTWRGEIIASHSGALSSHITYGAYGVGDVGNAPIISGAEVITGWTHHQGNIYKATVPQAINQLFFNSSRLVLARHPNTGYFTIDASPDSVTLVDNDLTTTVDWTGARAHIRSHRWTLNSKDVVSFNAGTSALELDSETHYGIKPGWGYFLNNKLEALDTAGEWYYDQNTNEVYLWMPNGNSPSTYQIEGSVYTNGFTLNQKNFITINGFRFEYQAENGIEASESSNLNIKNNLMYYPNSTGVFLGSGIYLGAGETNNFLDNNIIRGANHYGVIFNSKNSTFSNNSIENTSLIQSVNASGFGDFCCSGRAINVLGDNNLIRSNKINNSGYNGIGFDGQNTILEYNFITNSCLSLDDGGGIYTWNSDYNLPGSAGSIIRNNIVLDTKGAPQGTSNRFYKPAEGIYIDDRIHNVTLEGNTVAYSGSSGIFIHNNKDITVTNNTLYGNDIQIKLGEGGNLAPNLMKNNILSQNVYYPLTEDQLNIQQTTSFTYSNPVNFGAFDNNYYGNPYGDFNILSENNIYSLENWQIFSSQDINSETGLVQFSPYTITSIGTNLINNGTFDSNTSSWSRWPSANQITWDNTALDNGCLRFNYIGTGNNNILHSDHFQVVEGQQYLLKFSIISNQSGTISTKLRQGVSPYQILSLNKLFFVDTTRREYEFLFTANQDSNPTRLEFQSKNDISLYWIDNINLYEVTAIRDDPREKSKLFYNATMQTKVIDLESSVYLDLDGNTVNNSISLEPFTSKILILTDLIADEDTQHILLYPNPTKDVITLDLGELRRVKITINDVLGKTMYINKNTGQTMQISMKGFATGVYFLNIQKIDNEQVSLFKIIKID